MSTHLEKRTASLESALEQTASFGEAILTALRSMVERLQSLESALEQNADFAESVPLLLSEITNRIDALEDAMQEEAESGETSEHALKNFSERMDALKKSLAPILQEASSPHHIDFAKVKTTEAPAVHAVDPTVAPKLKEMMERIGKIEADLARNVQPSNQNTVLTPAIFDALRETLKSVVDRMSVIETSAMRLSAAQQSHFNPTMLDPLRNDIGNVVARVSKLEERPVPEHTHTAPHTDPALHAELSKIAVRLNALEIRQEHAVAIQEDHFGSTFPETLSKISERITHLESRPATQGIKAGSNDSTAGYVQLLAKASGLFPKTRTVVFVGTENFSDNIKYAYLSFCHFAAGKEINVSFLCATYHQYEQLRAAGLPCISPHAEDWSPENARTLISAKVVLLGDNFHARSRQGSIAHALLQGAKSIQLWHGIPFKEVGLQHLFTTRDSSDFLVDDLASSGIFDVLVSPTVTTRREWERCFSFREFAPVGLPRMDVFFRDLNENDHINVDMRTLNAVQAAHYQDKHVVLYAPTFRDHNPQWLEHTNLEAFAARCVERGWLLYINLHPREQGQVAEMRRRYPNIFFIEPGTDIFPVMKYVDVLVTDYSSLAFDFLYIEKPVVFFRPDHGEYMNRARELLADYESLTIGPVVSDVEALADHVTSLIDQPETDTFRDARTKARRKMFDYHDSKSCARLNAVIQRHLEPGIRFVPMVS